MRENAKRAADTPVHQSDLDFIDQEIAELWSGVERLQAHIVRSQDLGRPMVQSLALLDTARVKLHELLRRRTAMFLDFVRRE